MKVIFIKILSILSESAKILSFCLIVALVILNIRMYNDLKKIKSNVNYINYSIDKLEMNQNDIKNNIHSLDKKLDELELIIYDLER